VILAGNVITEVMGPNDSRKQLVLEHVMHDRMEYTAVQLGSLKPLPALSACCALHLNSRS